MLFSEDGRTVDQIGGRRCCVTPACTIATAESCTGGLLAARLTELPGSSDYVVGGIVAYSNEVKTAEAGVPAELIERHGAVSQRSPMRWHAGARESGRRGRGRHHRRRGSGGRHAREAGRPRVAERGSGGRRRERVLLTRSVNLPGGRADIRDRATTVAMHLVRRALLGEGA